MNDDIEDELEPYQQIVSMLDTWSDWELAEDREELHPVEIVETGSGDTAYFWKEEPYEGRTRFNISSVEDEPIVDGVLVQPLDHTIPEPVYGKSRFLQGYTDTVDEIVELMTPGYRTPDNPYEVMSFELDREDYSPQEFAEMLRTISDVSNQVQGLQEIIYSPVESHLSE